MFRNRKENLKQRECIIAFRGGGRLLLGEELKSGQSGETGIKILKKLIGNG